MTTVENIEFARYLHHTADTHRKTVYNSQLITAALRRFLAG